MSLPTIGFFAPLPLPMMIPFMGIQSAVMAEQFGTMFQYGKRRISAMSNEEFNALTPEKLQQRMTMNLQGMIPEMEKQIQTMGPLMEIILKEFGSYLSRAYELIVHEGRHALGTIQPHTGTGTVTVPGSTSTCPPGSHWDSARGTCVPDTTTTPTDTIIPDETTTVIHHPAPTSTFTYTGPISQQDVAEGLTQQQQQDKYDYRVTAIKNAVIFANYRFNAAKTTAGTIYEDNLNRALVELAQVHYNYFKFYGSYYPIPSSEMDWN